MADPIIPPSIVPVVEQPVAPKTTTEQDRTSAGQRHINVKWESTQQIIAISVALDALLICTGIVFKGEPTLMMAAFLFVTNLAFLVVGTYFQRTNHTKTGGVGGANETER